MSQLKVFSFSSTAKRGLGDAFSSWILQAFTKPSSILFLRSVKSASRFIFSTSGAYRGDTPFFRVWIFSKSSFRFSSRVRICRSRAYSSSLILSSDMRYTKKAGSRNRPSKFNLLGVNRGFLFYTKDKISGKCKMVIRPCSDMKCHRLSNKRL